MEEPKIPDQVAAISQLPLEERADALDLLVAELERRLESTSRAAQEHLPRR